jgi:HAD superfamily hydrolase (TIGR01484 family)
MPNIPKLAIFDIDGTIAQRGVVDDTALTGIQYLQSVGCITTVSTGRGYGSLRSVFGDNFEQVISEDALIMLEHGTKIVNRNGSVEFGAYFSDAEKDHTIDFARANIGLVSWAMITSDDPLERDYVICLDQRKVQELTEKYGDYMQISAGSIGEFRSIVMKLPVTNIKFALHRYVTVENLKLVLTRTEISIIFQDGYMEFVKHNVNKGIAVSYVADKFSLKMEDVLVAGNAINDVEMLDIGAGTAILVGPDKEREVIQAYLSEPSMLVHVDSPRGLGSFLQSLR